MYIIKIKPKISATHRHSKSIIFNATTVINKKNIKLNFNLLTNILIIYIHQIKKIKFI